MPTSANNSNCYFKQLARKTQIVEQQQKTLDELIGCVSIWEGFTEEESKLAKDSSIADLIMLLRKKTQECEQKQKIIEELKKEAKRISANYIKDEARYRKALEEIEKYQKRNCEVCSFAETKKCDIRCQVFVILDIVNKAKGEEDKQ